jgi:hypothetical protein
MGSKPALNFIKWKSLKNRIPLALQKPGFPYMAPSKNPHGCNLSILQGSTWQIMTEDIEERKLKNINMTCKKILNGITIFPSKIVEFWEIHIPQHIKHGRDLYSCKVGLLNQANVH